MIAVYNDWSSLDECLRSLQQQAPAPSFEIIVVDDGSKEPAPEFIRRWLDRCPLTIVREPHAGISVARNRGLQIARGTVFVFVDSDCRLQDNCLAAVRSTVASSPQHNAFQLHLTGDCAGLVGKAEELRLITLQAQMLQPDGCIRYLNTAGFAIRRIKVESDGNLFDPVARRAEDTLLLTSLMEDGELPLFVPDATVQHVISLSLMGWFFKCVRSAFLEAKTYHIIGSKAARFRASNRERWMMLRSMWKTSQNRSIGRLAWFAVVTRQLLRLTVLSLARVLQPGAGSSS